jgi:hypothetical protein
MRSLPLAIGWEMLHRGRWGLILAALGANALPVLLFTVLRYDGALDPAEPSGIIMHAVVVQINLFLFGTAVVAALWPMSRLYTYPVSTESLVGWHLLLGMAAVALEMVAAIAFLNAIFDLGWRPWGPALFAAAAFAGLQASLWLAEKSGWFPVAFGVVAIPLCLWFKWQYGPLIGNLNHYWTVVTLGDAVTLAAIPVGAYCVGVFGVTRNRCGSPPFSIGLVDWLQRLFAIGPETGLALRDPLRAQLWFEWRTKGVVMPAIVGMGLFMGGGMWLLASRNANALFEGLIAGGALLVLASLLGGFVLGNVGRADSDIQIGQFLATRPLTNTQLAGTILKTTAKSVFLGWVIWALAFLVIYAILRALPVTLRAALPAPLGWWYMPVALLGAWIAAGVVVSLALTGRQHLLAWFFFVGVTLVVGLMVFSKTVLSSQAQDYFARGVAGFCGFIFLLGTIWALVAARRRELITGQTLSLGAVTWAALCILAVLFWSPTSVDRLGTYILIIGILALAVAPLATAPLALAWNRTR